MLKVTNLPVPTTESDLYELFSGYGKIEIDPPIEIKNGNSIAYVKLGNDEDEKDAIKKLDRLRWRGEYIRVDTFRGRRPKGQPGDNTNKPENQDTINTNKPKNKDTITIGQPGDNTNKPENKDTINKS